jgi:hypothetical protein
MSERRVEKKLRFHPKFGDQLELVVYVWQIQTFFSLQYGDVGPFFPQKKTKSFVYESHTTFFFVATLPKFATKRNTIGFEIIKIKKLCRFNFLKIHRRHLGLGVYFIFIII